MPRSFHAAALGFTAGVAIGTLHPLSWSVLGAFAFSSVVWSLVVGQSSRAFLIGVFCIAATCGAGRALLVPHDMSSGFMPLVGTHAHIEGTLVAMPDARETTTHLTLEIRKGDARTRVLVTIARDARAFRIGDRIDASGMIARPQPFGTDGGRTFPYDKFLEKDGTFLAMQPADARVVGRSSDAWLAFLRALQSVHDAFVSATERALPEPHSSLSVGVIAGGKQGLGTRLLTDFQAAGLLQLVVLSGYNVMIIAEGLLALLARTPARIAFGAAGFGIFSFVLAAGAGSSAVRAGIMAGIALVARAAGRSYDALRALLLALVFMLLWNPLELVYDPGLQLSVLATLGLILGVPLVEARLLRLPGMLRDMVATTVAAQAAVLPMLLYQSGNLSLVALPANLLSMPLVPPAMAAGGVAAACALPSSVPRVVVAACAAPAQALLSLIIGIARAAASIPLAQATVPAFPAWVLVMSYAALGLFVLHERARLERIQERPRGSRGRSRQKEGTRDSTPPSRSVPR